MDKMIHPMLCAILMFAQVFLTPWAMADTAAGASSSPCDYYTSKDAESLFGVPVQGPVVKPTRVPAGEGCRYTFPHKGGTCGAEIRMSTSREISEEGLFTSAADQMKRQRSARQASDTASKKFKEIEGMGDEAFWSGDTLWMRKAETLIMISVHAPLNGAFANMTAASAASAEQNLTLSKKVAHVILSRLP